MLRLLTIEWIKLKSFKMFWVSVIAYIVVVAMVLSYAANAQIDLEIVKYKLLEFPHAWKYISDKLGILNILLSAVIVFYMCDEYRNQTLRKQVIDGMSEKEFILAKVMIILLLGIVSTFTIFVFGIIYTEKPSQDWAIVWSEIYWLGIQYISVITYLSIAMLLAIIIKRAVPTLLILFVLHFVEWWLLVRFGHPIFELFPLTTLDALIKSPWLPGMPIEPEYFSTKVMIIATILYFLIANLLSWFKLKRSSI